MYSLKFFLLTAFVVFAFHGFTQVAMQRNSLGEIMNLADAKFTKVVEGFHIDGLDLNTRIPFENIRGSRFWKDEWELASIYSNDRRISIVRCRMNLATQEVHFLLNDKEVAASNSNYITSVLFHKGSNPSIVTAAFVRDIPDLFFNKKKVDGFLQVMNFGEYQLLKYTKRIVDNADSLFGTQKRYFFKDELYYFVMVNDKVEKVKRLNEEYILSLIPSASNHKLWIKENNLNFKKEEDVIRFLNYYNSQASLTPIK